MSGVSYIYNPTGKVIIGGTTIYSYNPNSNGGVRCGGTALINTATLVYSGTGGLVIGDTADLTGASYLYNTIGPVVIGGGATITKSFYSYESDGGLIVSGASDFRLAFFDRTCLTGDFECIVNNAYQDCADVQFFYAGCELLDKDVCRPSSGAFLAAITACRQKFILPDKDRRPDIPKRN
jgi:hypothetical protein